MYRRKILTGSPDPTHANGTDKPCNDFISAMILTDLMVDHVMVEDIRFVKEEVRAVAAISNCIGFGRRVLSVCVRVMIKKSERHCHKPS